MVDMNVTLECIPPDGYPDVTISWWNNGTELMESSENPMIRFSDNKRFLIIGAIRLADSGSYTCRAGNEIGTRTSRELEIKVRGE